MKKINEIIQTPSQWSGDDRNLANTYLNIANVLPVIQNWMKSHVDNVKNGGGCITIGDIEEALKFMEESINNRLISSMSNKVTISLSTSPTPTLSPITPTITKEAYKRENKVRLTESDLHRIVKESVKSILNEFDWFGMQKEHQPIEARQYLPQNVRHRFVIGKNGNFVYRDADYNEHDTGINPSRVAQLSSDGKCNEKGLQAIGQALNNFNNRNVKNIESNLDSSNRAMANFNREKAERDAYEAQRNKEWAQQDAAAQRNYANKQYGYQRGMGRSSIY